MNSLKYTSYLEKEIHKIKEENKQLKAKVSTSNQNEILTTANHLPYSNNDPPLIDLRKITKIQPKQKEENSPLTNQNFLRDNKISNLNGKTAQKLKNTSIDRNKSLSLSNEYNSTYQDSDIKTNLINKKNNANYYKTPYQNNNKSSNFNIYYNNKYNKSSN